MNNVQTLAINLKRIKLKKTLFRLLNTRIIGAERLLEFSRLNE